MKGTKRATKAKKKSVEITLFEARNLPAMDPNGLCDAFVRFFIVKEGETRSESIDDARSTTKFKVQRTDKC